MSALQPRSRRVLCSAGSGWQSMAYVEWGAADNPEVVVCVHGLTRNGRDFDVLAGQLAADYRVVCPDMIGRGLSAWSPQASDYGYARYLTDIAVLLARLDVERVHWIGTSMGGILGMMVAALPDAPLHSLVLNDVGARVPQAALEVIAAYVGGNPAFAQHDEAVRYLSRLHAGFGLSPAQWEVLAPHSLRQDPDAQWRLRYDPAIAAAFKGPLAEVDLRPWWQAVKVPTLVLRGERSQLLTPEILSEMLALRPDTATVTVADCGHAPGLQSAVEVEALRGFLARHRAR